MGEDGKLFVLRQYEEAEWRYRDLSESVAALLQRILAQAGIQVHSITHRTKDRESLNGKLSRSDKQYSTLEEITDLAGVRIITYFASDVDKVASIVEREFKIDEENSIDKRTTLDPDRFGYLSRHYVASLAEGRAMLPEYVRLNSLKFEIQVRSILQHSWAEIEHDLGYKSKAGVPREVQRRFARVAGLLELADTEFEAIRADLEAYAATVATAIQSNPEDVTIDKLSLLSYIKSNEVIQQFDRVTAEILQSEIRSATDANLDSLALQAQWLGIQTIADLSHYVDRSAPILGNFIQLLAEGSKVKSVWEGIALAQLFYIIAATKGEEVVLTYLTEFKLGSDENRQGSVEHIMRSYNRALQKE